MKVLITGGGGFIGSRLARSLRLQGSDVRVLDVLSPQIHGENARFPESLLEVAECRLGDVRDVAALEDALADCDAVVHLAAETGTGQSMYAVERYSDVNIRGTAVLFDIIVNRRPASLRKVVVASSRAVYGEGLYHCETHGAVYPSIRSAAALAAGEFEPRCPHCSLPVEVRPTPEEAPFAPTSFYGLSKQAQDQMTIMFGNAMGIDAFALRFQNVYGPGQSLLNPYTGLLAVFSNLARAGKPISVFEDGLESRDFIYVDDVIRSIVAVLSPNVGGVHALNVGSGVRTTVLEVAQAVVRHLGANVPIRVTGDYRLGDIRHNVADVSRLHDLTGFTATWPFAAGLAEFLDWAMTEPETEGGFEASLAELRARGLFASAAPAPLTAVP